MEGGCLSGCFPVIKAKGRTGYIPFYPFMEKTGSLCMWFYRRRLIRKKACGSFLKNPQAFFFPTIIGKLFDRCR